MTQHASFLFFLGRAALLAAASLSLLLAPAAQGAAVSGSHVSAQVGTLDSVVSAGGFGQPAADIQRTSRVGNRAHARADLRDGALHASADTVSQSLDCWLGVPHACVDSHAAARAVLYDTITLLGDERGPTVVNWGFTLTGSEDKGPWLGNQGSGGWGRFAYHVSTQIWRDIPRYFDVDPGDHVGGSFEIPGGPDASLTLYVYAGLLAEATNGGRADYSHTARFAWDLPAGIRYSSQSGVFMADHPAPQPGRTVPEPGSLALAGAVLLGRWGTARRRVGRGG